MTTFSNYSKIKFLSKNSILTKLCNFLGKSKLSTTKKCKSPTFSRVFHPNFFWQFFSWNQSCQQLKSPKPQHFHEFSPKTIRQFFSGNQSWIFGQKMKISNSVDFENDKNKLFGECVDRVVMIWVEHWWLEFQMRGESMVRGPPWKSSKIKCPKIPNGMF